MITNATQDPASYVMAVVPIPLAAAAAVPWSRVVEQIKSRPDGLQITLQQLAAAILGRLRLGDGD